MLATNLKVLGIVVATLVLYTLLANAIPQIESDVPEALSFTGEVTAEQLVAAGEELFHGAGGCVACHGLGARAPNLLSDEGGTGLIGERCQRRQPGSSCKDYLYAAMTDPNSFVVEGYSPIMPDMRRTMSAAQIWALIAFLERQGGTVTVTAADIGAATGGAAPPAGAPAAATSAPAGSGSTEPTTLLGEFQCLACHVLDGQGGPIGPPFDGIGGRLTEADLRRSILEPNAEVAEGYEAVAGTMPADFGRRLTAAQLEALVRFLAEQE